MSKLFAIAIIVTHLTEAFILNEKNFCIIDEKKCVGQLDSSCRASRCNSNHEYQCLKNMCTRKQTHCDDFKRDFFLMRKFQARSIALLIKNTKKCVQEAYSLKEDDICVSERDCFLTLKSLLSKATLVKLVKCECPKSLKFRCSSIDSCTIHNEACNAVQSARFKSNRSCNNSRNYTLVTHFADLRFSRF